jgi:hypothetical protein
MNRVEARLCFSAFKTWGGMSWVYLWIVDLYICWGEQKERKRKREIKDYPYYSRYWLDNITYNLNVVGEVISFHTTFICESRNKTRKFSTNISNFVETVSVSSQQRCVHHQTIGEMNSWRNGVLCFLFLADVKSVVKCCNWWIMCCDKAILYLLGIGVAVVFCSWHEICVSKEVFSWTCVLHVA